MRTEAILTEAELAVLELIAIGTDYQAIASSLDIQLETVNTCTANIIDRLNLSKLTQNVSVVN